MTHIYLMAGERSAFDALPPDVRSGWQVEEERGTPSDSPEKRSMRMQLLHLRDPKLQGFLQAANAVGSLDAMVALLNDTSLEGVADNDLEELFFALGPEALSVFIAAELTRVQSDHDLEGVVALTVIRHSLLEAMHS